MRWPNPRLQRTPSALPPSPLSRKPLGGRIRFCPLTHGMVAMLVLASALVAGCLHTFTGATFYYPPGTRHDDSQYRLLMEFHGASGHTYVDRTEKTINLAIKSGDATLLHRWYNLVAGDLDAGVTWERADDLTIVFYEPDRSRALTIPRQELLRLHFTLDAATSQFVEAPLTSSDVEALKVRQ